MNIPNHIGIIVDGNRRWAGERGVPDFEGHSRGLEVIRESAGWSFERGIKVLSCYAFSSENWKRSPEEVDYLMNTIFRERLFGKDLDYYSETGVKIIVTGRRQGLPGDLLEAIETAERCTEKNTGGTLNFCLNYGGRAEITDAVRAILRNSPDIKDIDEDLLEKNLYRADLSAPELIIRTGGRKRMSNFLLWQAAYSELYFIDRYWPDFSPEDLDAALEDFSQRRRNYGA